MSKQQYMVDAELLYRERGRLLYDDSMYFQKVNDFIFLFLGIPILLGFIGMNVFLVYYVFLFFTAGAPLAAIFLFIAVVLFSGGYLLSAFLIYLFFYVLRTNPVKVYENGFVLGWRNSPEYHPYTDVQKYDTEDEGGTINIKFKSYKTCSISYKLPADYKVSRQSPLVMILLEQLDRAWNREEKNRRKLAKAKALVWAAKARKAERRNRRFEKIKYTKNGLTLTLAGLLWTFFLPVVGLIIFIIGQVNFYKGKREFGPVHSRNITTALILFFTGGPLLVLGLIFTFIGYGFHLVIAPLAGTAAALAGYGLILSGISLSIFTPAPRRARILLLIGPGYFIIVSIAVITFTILNIFSIISFSSLVEHSPILTGLLLVFQIFFHWSILGIYAVAYIMTDNELDRTLDRAADKKSKRKRGSKKQRRK